MINKMLTTLIICALLTTCSLAGFFDSTFIEGDFSSLGQPYDIHQKKMAQLLGLTTQSYKYTVSPGQLIEISGTLQDHVSPIYSDGDTIRFQNATSKPLRGTLIIYRYQDIHNGDTVFELEAANPDGRGERTNRFFKIHKATIEKMVAMTCTGDEFPKPWVKFTSETEAVLFETHHFVKADHSAPPWISKLLPALNSPSRAHHQPNSKL